MAEKLLPRTRTSLGSTLFLVARSEPKAKKILQAGVV